jgi:hypothetical protein
LAWTDRTGHAGPVERGELRCRLRADGWDGWAYPPLLGRSLGVCFS